MMRRSKTRESMIGSKRSQKKERGVFQRQFEATKRHRRKWMMMINGVQICITTKKKLFWAFADPHEIATTWVGVGWSK